jgi:hypothetical protein
MSDDSLTAIEIRLIAKTFVRFPGQFAPGDNGELWTVCEGLVRRRILDAVPGGYRAGPALLEVFGHPSLN